MIYPELFGLDAFQVWDTEHAVQQLRTAGQANSRRTAERRLHDVGMLPAELKANTLQDELGRHPIKAVLDHEIRTARSKRKLLLFAQLHTLPGGRECLHANDPRGGRYWIPLSTQPVTPELVAAALQQLHIHIGKEITIFPHGRLVGLCRGSGCMSAVSLLAYPAHPDSSRPPQPASANHPGNALSPHLKRLEAESIHIFREAVAEADRPAMLYSMGKDSAVMLHLARKAFYPAPPPFPLLHIDTRWKFQEMYLMRDHIARESGLEILVHVNPEAIAKNINPFDHGSSLHTDITKTEGLKQALDQYKFDLLFGGARRDEEKSRAKERIFSLRSASQNWDPKMQRPEIWNLFNTTKNPGENLRVFPLSNWTEIDIWHYIRQESIPVVPLYFAKQRPVILRNGMIMLVDDDRCRLLPGEIIETRMVRFRTLGCYPLTGATESTADTVDDIILELVASSNSERQGRKIDYDAAASMEHKKREGYF